MSTEQRARNSTVDSTVLDGELAKPLRASGKMAEKVGKHKYSNNAFYRSEVPLDVSLPSRAICGGPVTFEYLVLDKSKRLVCA
jgi:hypothetical protein